MKQIEKVPIWDNGKNQSATILNAYCINDNLSTSATFYYALLSDTKQTLATGKISMSGEVYDYWETNEYVYKWIANELNLVIVGDWIEPIGAIVEPIVKESLTVEGA